MQKRRLGNSALEISTLGFGAWAIGGGQWQYGWGSQDDSDSIAAIYEALEAGVNWIDTAAVYGLGRSEEVVAQALAGWKGEKPFVFTKCSMRWDEKRQIYRSLKAASVREECENSLRRLNAEAIDLYQIHFPDPSGEIEEGWTALAQLQKEGKIRYLGVSNFTVAQLKRVKKLAPVTSLQPPYSLLTRDIETGVLPYCQEQSIGVVVYSPMESGLLTGAMTRERIAALPTDDWRREKPDYLEPNLSRNLALVELLKQIGARHGKSAGEVAIAWVLRHPTVTGAIVGLRRPGQAAGTLGAANFRLSEQEQQQLSAFLKSHMPRNESGLRALVGKVLNRLR